MTKLFVMVGIPGSGKSHIGNQIAELFDCEVVSSDAMREKWYGDADDQKHNSSLWPRLFALTKEKLSAKKDIVFDATNVSIKDRKKFIQMKNELGVKLIAIVVNTSIDVAKKRNLSRERIVPDEVIERMSRKLVIPTQDEGFDIVFCVEN